MDECKHCQGSIRLQPCGPGQVWVHRRNGFALCSLDEDCTTWAEPLECKNPGCCVSGACEICPCCNRGYCDHEAAEYLASLAQGDAS